jgi:cell wall-associated NlpC family hydrolase
MRATLIILACWLVQSLNSFSVAQEEIIDTLSQDSTLLAIELPIDTIDYQTDEELIGEIIEFAKLYIGVPYVYGGTTPRGFDCSGYVRFVMDNFDIPLTRTSSSMSEEGEEVPLSEVQPGDLLFFKGRNRNSTRVGHVAMVIEVVSDEIKFIHSAGNMVKISTFNESNYYVPRFIKAKRISLNRN